MSFEYWPTTAERWNRAESHKVATWDDFLRSFEEAPIVPAEKPTEPEKNKYVRWDTPMTTEVDAEIKRMNIDGKTNREISEELAKRNIFVTWQKVQGRIAFMTRKPKEALQTHKDEGKTPEMQSSRPKPGSAKTSQPIEPAAEPDIPPKILKRIRELEEEDYYTSAAISTKI